MEKSSHYYGIYALCLSAGIKDAVSEKIAYASQFVDDAKINTITFDKDYSDPQFSLFNGKSKISNIATCHSYFKLKTLNYQAMIYNTSAFHFFPANKGNSFTRRMRCNENPAVLRGLIEETIKQDTLIPEQLGMLLHVFADTYAHQGFSGLISKENDIAGLVSSQEHKLKFTLKLLFRNVKGWFLKVFDQHVPAYGHAQAYTYPDIPFGYWQYSYDTSDDFSDEAALSENNNTQRYTAAFTTIAVDFLKNIQDSTVFEEDSQDSETKAAETDKVIDVLVTPASHSKKIKMWKRLIADITGKPEPEYDESKWLKEVFPDYSKKKYEQRVVTNAKLKPDYHKSSWYSFILAMKWYKQEFMERNAQAGLVIPY